MLIFADSFDHYATADITKKWTLHDATITATNGRRGSPSLRMIYVSSTAKSAQKTLSAKASWIVGFSYRPTVLPPTASAIICSWLDVSTVQCTLSLNTNGTLVLSGGGGTSTFALGANQEYYIEWKVTIADSITAGSCKVRVNGVDVITAPAGADMKATANATADGFRFGALNQQMTVDYDDLYICDQSGTTNNDFLGDIRVDTLFPNADGTYSQFTPSTGTNHSALVDEATPNTTDYNFALTPGLRDSYAFQDLPSLVSPIVYGVQVNAALLKDDAGNKQVALFTKTGAENSDGATFALGTSQTYVSQIFERNLNGTADWTQASVNAAEFGAKIVV